MRLAKFETLSKSEMQDVHEASLDVLENCGIVIHSQKVLAMLKENGADVDESKELAKMNRALVQKCIDMAPSEFTLYNRNKEEAFVVGDSTPRCASGHNAIFLMDTSSSDRRYAKVSDVEAFAIVSEKMRDIDIVGVPLNPQDVPDKATLLYAVKALFENTTKPLFFSTESREVNKAIIDMMKVVAGTDDIASCPNAICQLSPTSPLYWEPGAVEGVVDAAKNGVPLTILPEPMSGVSAPYSVAGLLTVHNTEVLSGVVISQLINPGTPIVYGSSWTTYNMKSTAAIIASPETNILRVAGCQMARFYGLPSHTTALNSDSNCHDEQNAWEKSLSNMAAICADNDIVMNAGMYASGLTISLEQLVLDDEMNGLIRRLRKGVEVSRESIAAEVIKNVGPVNDYFMQEHTLENLRSGEFRESELPLAKNYEEWISQNAPGVELLAKRKVDDIMSKGNSKPLEEHVRQGLEHIIKKFEKEHC
ncbi:MAG: hypothetical protein HN389_12450 [Clostridia bacterium]|jgi:trimethylamine---corrinoid protein Co-methyltransferase|nr:hypothetical protein [Clostridia bacterium]